MEKVLCGSGVIIAETSFDFDFKDVTMNYESYNGLNVCLRFVLPNSALLKKFFRSTRFF